MTRDGDPGPATPLARRARDDDMAAVLALRHAVFCEEQGVPPERERDADDATAVHLVVDDEGAVIGTCRLLAAGEVVRLGRMAVTRARRGEGLGALLLACAHEVAAEAGAREVELHAQVAVRRFYERAGYTAEGVAFVDAGIEHIMMRRRMSAHI